MVTPKSGTDLKLYLCMDQENSTKKKQKKKQLYLSFQTIAERLQWQKALDPCEIQESTTSTKADKELIKQLQTFLIKSE